MIVKTKRIEQGNIVKMSTGGEIKEFTIHTNAYNNDDSISICYKGKVSSGVIQLSKEELNQLYKTVSKKVGLVKEVKLSE